VIAVLGAIAVGAAYVVAVLKSSAILQGIGLLGGGMVGLALLAWIGALDVLAATIARYRTLAVASFAIAVTVVIAVCHTDHFALITLASMLILGLGVIGVERHVVTGVPNLGGAAIAAIGGYAAAGAVVTLGTGHAGGLAIAGALSALSALPLVLLTRDRALHGALATLALGLTVERLLKAGSLLGFDAGIKLPPLSFAGFDVGFGIEIGPYQVSQYAVHAFVALVVLVFVLALVAVAGVRRWAQFAVGGLALGVAGALQVYLTGFVGPDMFGVTESLVLISLGVIGGLGSLSSSLLVALFAGLLIGKVQLLQELRAPIVLVFLLVMVVLRPQGLMRATPTADDEEDET